jgi:hypothetical protein
VTFATLSAAVALTSVSAAFSIDGLTAIFAGAFWPVIAMGTALEVDKLVATAWLRENWRTAPSALRTGLAAMIAVLMALNAVGVFGFLTRAHLERQLAIEVVAADRLRKSRRACLSKANSSPILTGGFVKLMQQSRNRRVAANPLLPWRSGIRCTGRVRS